MYEKEGIIQIESDELEEMMGKQDKAHVKIIDVREPEEYQAGHIPGVPLVPMGDVPEELQNWNKEEEFILVCRSGRRSQIVSQYMKENGFEKVKNFAGGMLTWQGELEFDDEKK